MRRPSILLLHGLQSSRTTWWRAEQDLTDLGWDVTTLDLLGHGARAQRTTASSTPWTLAQLAEDVAARLREAPIDVVVGHSLGGVIALLLLQRCPAPVRAVVLEDPPALGSSWRTRDVARDIERSSARAHADPVAEVTALLAAHPAWTPLDAQTAVDNRRMLDVGAVSRCVRAAEWDLPALVRGCPVPLMLIMAASEDTALRSPDREAVVDLLPPQRVLAVNSGHSVHRDRPGMWLCAVTGFAAATVLADP